MLRPDAHGSGLDAERVRVPLAVQHERRRIPRDRDDDYTPVAAARRRAFLQEQTGVALEHVSHYSFDPAVLAGNVEHFTGVAQVPVGIAGPLLVNGEHAQGELRTARDDRGNSRRKLQPRHEDAVRDGRGHDHDSG